MNKKLKKMLAAVSAVAVCAGSVISTCAGAVAIFMDKTGETYEVYTELGGSIVRKTNSYNNPYAYYYRDGNIISPITFYFDKYSNVEIEKAENLSEFLSENYPSVIVEYDISDGINTTSVNLDYNEEVSFEEKLQIAADIKKNFNLGIRFSVLLSGKEITEIENELPEVTLAGDANEDGEVNISDAVLIMQAIANPEEFELTWQGIANADVYGDGDGVTLMDAFTIQEMSLNKSNA